VTAVKSADINNQQPTVANNTKLNKTSTHILN